MRQVTRAAVVAGIVVAGVLTLAPARNGGAMTNGLVWGSQNMVQGARRVAAGMSRLVTGFFNQGAAPAYAQGQNQDELAQEMADFVWHGTVRTGQTLEIKGVNGDIIAQRAAGGEIEVRAEKRAGDHWRSTARVCAPEAGKIRRGISKTEDAVAADIRPQRAQPAADHAPRHLAQPAGVEIPKINGIGPHSGASISHPGRPDHGLRRTPGFTSSFRKSEGLCGIQKAPIWRAVSSSNPHFWTPDNRVRGFRGD